MPKKKSPNEDPKQQHERFKEAARDHGATDGNKFDRAFEKAVPPAKGKSRP